MELREILAIVRRRWWILLAVPVTAAVIAASVSFFVITPTYEASTSLWVVMQEGGGIDYNTLLLNRNLVKTYGEVAKSRTVVQAVIDTLSLPDTIEDLQERIQVSAVRDTEIINVSVQDESPQRAARIANALAAAFMGEIQNFVKLDNIRVVDTAVVPPDPFKPRPLRNTIVAFVLGVMVALGLVMGMEYLDVTIRTPEDAERHLELPVIGVIPIIAAVKTAGATMGGSTTGKTASNGRQDRLSGAGMSTADSAGGDDR